MTGEIIKTDKWLFKIRKSDRNCVVNAPYDVNMKWNYRVAVEHNLKLNFQWEHEMLQQMNNWNKTQMELHIVLRAYYIYTLLIGSVINGK